MTGDTEARLRAAIETRTAAVRPSDDETSLAAIDRGLASATARHRARRNVLAGLSMAAAITLVAVAVPLLRADKGGDQVRTTGPGTTTATTSAPTPTTAVPVDPTTSPEVVWPPPTADHPRFQDPVDAVRSFAMEYVKLPKPALGAYRPNPGLSRGGEVDVLAQGEDGGVLPGQVRSTVSVGLLNGYWYVTGARSADIVVERPAPLDSVGSLVVVDGRGRGYEGTIVTKVRGAYANRDLATKVTTAGCCEELIPFYIEVPAVVTAADCCEELLPMDQAKGSVLLYNDSGFADIDSFTVVPIRFGGTSAPSDETTVDVSWTRPGGELVATKRTVRKSAGVLRSALVQLLYGPTSDEREQQLSSGLDNAAAGSSVSVVIRDGRAVIDFGADLPSLSPSTSSAEASQRFLRQLHATVFQFPTVTEAEYRVGGSCAAFWEWLQRSCTTVTKSNAGV